MVPTRRLGSPQGGSAVRPIELQTLFRHNRASNERLLSAAAQVPPDRLTTPAPVSHGSLLGTLAHVYAAERIWRMRCQEGVSPPALPTGADFETLAALCDRWAAETASWAAYLAGLEEGDLDRAVRYTNTTGTVFETPLWQIMLHVVNHGTQFRGEAAVLLTQYGASPGDLDLIGYLRSVERVSSAG